MEKVFPTIMIALSICAAMVYIPSGDWRHAGYWFAAAALNFCVTW